MPSRRDWSLAGLALAVVPLVLAEASLRLATLSALNGGMSRGLVWLLFGAAAGIAWWLRGRYITGALRTCQQRRREVLEVHHVIVSGEALLTGLETRLSQAHQAQGNEQAMGGVLPRQGRVPREERDKLMYMCRKARRELAGLQRRYARKARSMRDQTRRLRRYVAPVAATLSAPQSAQRSQRGPGLGRAATPHHEGWLKAILAEPLAARCIEEVVVDDAPIRQGEAWLVWNRGRGRFVLRLHLRGTYHSAPAIMLVLQAQTCCAANAQARQVCTSLVDLAPLRLVNAVTSAQATG
ncbi:hypothetical protein R5M92_10610 [Halomonas sp. Bachu 37]|uniref:hypothetical protein n=1 Tax=Halomonas kashgarensis TaxID=3084920 RepID=UPI0032165770